MLVRRIKAWIKSQNGKPPVLPFCIGRVHAKFLGHTKSGHWRWPNVENGVTERLFVNVTPRILICCTRFSPSSVSGVLILCFFRLSTKTISSLLLRFRERLLEVAQSVICWSSLASLHLVLTLTADIIRYVSSAYLHSSFPLQIA